MRYAVATQLELRNCRHGYIGMDATRVSTKDITFYVFEGLPARRSCWLVPKAPCHPKFWAHFSHFWVWPGKVTLPPPPYVSPTLGAYVSPTPYVPPTLETQKPETFRDLAIRW